MKPMQGVVIAIAREFAAFMLAVAQEIKEIRAAA